MVDGLLAAEDAEEEDGGERRRHQRHHGGDQSVAELGARNVHADPVDQLLEHQRVVALLFRLVRGVAKFLGAVGQFEAVLHQAADQDRLELQPDLRDVRLSPHADADLLVERLFLIPGVAADGVDLVVEHPARIVGHDGHVRSVPVDVEVGVEVSVHRRRREVVEDLLVFGAGKPVLGVDRRRLVGVVPQCLRHENRLPRDASGA